MGNSTTTLQMVNDWAKGKGIPVPTDQPAGYNINLALKIGNDVMSKMIAERFNWKFNRATAAPFYTNSFQQDYPQIGLTTIGWLEDGDRVDINNTAFPKPLENLTIRRQLSRTSHYWSPVKEVCWMPNSELSYGTWPGNSKTFSPLVTTGTVVQNPIMSMIDANGNLLIVTTFGTTAATGTGPVLPANSAEGVTVADGTVVWTVVSPNSQGFRVFPLPGASGPVYQCTIYYQMLLAKLTAMSSLINPIPDDYSDYFQDGYEAYCLLASPNPADKARAQGPQGALALWFKALMDAKKQGDREIDAYSMIPASSPVERVYGQMRNPQDPSQPY
jgi:hypothetical protein